MNSPLKIICVSAVLMAAPAIAQTDPHAGHHPAGGAVTLPTPAPTPKASEPHCPMMSAQVPADKARHQDAKPKQGKEGQDMMDTGMSTDMMKACMGGHAAPSTDGQRGN